MLQPFPYDTLYHYSEKFTRDVDLRQDLVLLAWKESLKDNKHSDIRLLKHYMKFRSKEIKDRNSLGKSIGGKSKKDVWRHDRVSIHRHLKDGSAFTLADTLTSVSGDPFGMCVVSEFEDALHGNEVLVAEQVVSGFNDIEGCKTLNLPMGEYRQLKSHVREKAVEYLV